MRAEQIDMKRDGEGTAARGFWTFWLSVWHSAFRTGFVSVHMMSFLALRTWSRSTEGVNVHGLRRLALSIREEEAAA